MRSELQLSDQPLDLPALHARREFSATAGAVVTFLGMVRGHEQATAIDGLEYEAFEAMVRYQFHLLFAELERRWPAVETIRLVHRTGFVPAGHPSLFVEVTAPHRPEAFAACQWLIDEMKRVVPIWKRTQPEAGHQR